MNEHTIELSWVRSTDKVTVKPNIVDLRIGDVILFKSKQGPALVVFPNGSPFSNKSFEVITDSDRPTVKIRRGPCSFLCGVVVNGKLHMKGSGGRTPPPGKKAVQAK